MKGYLVCMLGIFLLGFALRMCEITNSPPYLSNDEISIAYDVYSIGLNGRDEHGNLFPISFESLENRKAPMYAYLAVVPILILGTTDLAAKLPSVILGSLTIVVLGLIALRITKNKQISLITALILTTTPWHLFDSRKVLEANVALFFLAIGILMFLINTKSKAREILGIPT